MKKAIVKALLKALLGIGPLRRRLVFAFRHEHFDWLDVRIPIDDHYKAVLASLEAAESFSEIFVRQAYAPVLKETGLPQRFLDLGCHYGLFSLYLATQAKGAELHGLLVDGDARVRNGVEKLLTLNPGLNGCHFAHGVVGQGSGDTTFYLRPGMGSSSENPSDNQGLASATRIVSEDEMLKLLPPPYDLVKVDIEGGEGDFLAHYPRVLAEARHLLIEWHSWNGVGLSQEALIDTVARSGLTRMRCLEERDDIPMPSGPAKCAVYLFSRE